MTVRPSYVRRPKICRSPSLRVCGEAVYDRGTYLFLQSVTRVSASLTMNVFGKAEDAAA
jgi:hypothetical protein